MKKDKTYDITDRLFLGYAVAKDKHPEFADGEDYALQVILDEVKELEYAVKHEMKYRQVEEAWDVIVCCLRYILSEYDKDNQESIEHWESEPDDSAVRYYERNLRNRK